MGQRAEALAQRLEKANAELIATVERCSDPQWRTKTSAEGWSVGVVAHHVALAHGAFAGGVEAVANQKPLPTRTLEDLHKNNAEHARQHADCTRAETLDLLRSGGTKLAAVIRGLSDEQLGRSAKILADLPAMTAEQIIERIAINHVETHHGSIKAVTAGK